MEAIMFRFKHLPVIAIATAAVVVFPSLHASANIIVASGVSAVGQGFGSIPRLLTVQGAASPGPTGTTQPESACDANSGGTLVVGCLGVDATSGNGMINPTTNNGNVSPIGDSSKNNLVNLGDLGITDASQLF